MLCEYLPRYVRIGGDANGMNGINGVLYTPCAEYHTVGVLVMHSDSDYLNSPAGKGMAERGFLTLCANVVHPEKPLEQRLPDVNQAMQFLKEQPGIQKVVLLGHSGGATLMTCYEAVAENCPEIFQDEHRVVKMGEVDTLVPADGLLLIDSNFGNGVMTLTSIDPSVCDETDGTVREESLDPFAAQNGYTENGTTHYEKTFLERYYSRQAQRQGRLMQAAQNRLEKLEQGCGRFLDDEPFLAPGASQIAPNNRLFPQDLGLLAHTKGSYDLIHADGSVTREQIHSVRTARGNLEPTPLCSLGLLQTTVRTYLSSNCVRTTEQYCVAEDGINGIDYDSTYCCPPGNVKYIHIPLLVMGMTGGYECIASEIIYQNAASQDKSIAFVEGGTHMLGTAKDAEQYPGQFGDAAATLFDAIGRWLCEKMEG